MCMSKKSRLIKKFDSLKAQIHSQNEKNDLVQSNLYHFTNAIAFRAIITSKNLLLTSFNKLNDCNEIKFAKKFIFEVFSSYRGKYCSDFLSKFDSFLAKINVYVICFCVEVNNNHLWIKYGDNHRGVALGFLPSYKKHEEIDYSKESPSVIMHVKYGKKAISDDVLSFVDTFAKLLEMTKTESEYQKYVDGFVRNIYPNLPRYKGKDWKDEKEHRWCMMDRGPTKKILPEFIVGEKAVNKNVVFEQLCEVIIGKDSLMMVSEVQNHLETNGYDIGKITVTKM